MQSTRTSAPMHTTSSTSISSASLTASRKRKLLEQFLLPENGSSSNTISLSEMRTLGLVGQSRPSASVQPTSLASNPSALPAAAPSVSISTRSPVGGLNFSTVSGYVPSFSFYQVFTPEVTIDCYPHPFGLIYGFIKTIFSTDTTGAYVRHPVLLRRRQHRKLVQQHGRFRLRSSAGSAR